MTFLPAHMTDAANRYVQAQPEHRNPHFPRKTFNGSVTIRGSVLRYSTTTPAMRVTQTATGGWAFEPNIPPQS